MKSQNKKIAKDQRSKELLTLSNQLFSTAKQLSEYHAAELKSSMAHALSYAQTAAHQDMAQLKALQDTVASEATQRMGVYQEKVKVILDQMEGKSVDKHLKDARSVLADWYKDAKKKTTQGAEQIGQLAHEVSAVGIRAFKEGCKLVHEAADLAEKNLKKATKKEAAKAKKAPAKKPAVKKLSVKKVLEKKASVKEASAKTASPSTKALT